MVGDVIPFCCPSDSSTESLSPFTRVPGPPPPAPSLGSARSVHTVALRTRAQAVAAGLVQQAGRAVVRDTCQQPRLCRGPEQWLPPWEQSTPESQRWG